MNIKSIKGFTLGGFIALLVVVCIAAFFGMKVAPMYMEYGSVKQAMDGLANESYPSPSEAKKSLIKRLETNYVSSVSKDDITISANGGSFEVTVEYYVEKDLFANLTISGYFDYTVTTK